MFYTATLKFQHRPRNQGGWVGPYTFEAVVYDQPCAAGIDQGRVSRLGIQSNGKLIVYYDGAWIMPPTNRGQLLALVAILEKFPDGSTVNEAEPVDYEDEA